LARLLQRQTISLGRGSEAVHVKMAKKKVADAVQNVASKKKGKDIDPVRVFAEKMRDHKELESRWAVLQEARVEYFKGKDFVALLRAHPELLKPLAIESTTEDMEMEIGNLLLRRKLIVRCDRVLKTVRPGKTKLSKWPARIEFFPEQKFSEKDSFFAWTFERRRPLWQTVLSFLVPIVTLACCLFPVFPHWCKLGVLYFCLTLLSLIFGLLTCKSCLTVHTMSLMNLLSGSLGYRQVTTPNVGTGHVNQVVFLLLKAEKFVTACGILHAKHFKLVIVGYITFCWVQTRICFLCHSC
jgi:hypothetical protein